MAKVPLPVITALARSGALDRAWALFEASGYDQAVEDAAALSVKGRLLKDRAILLPQQRQANLLLQAAQAYAAADKIAPAPYLLINVATLHFLAGEKDAANGMAQEVLKRLSNPDLAETPYWIAATRAEALLLQSRVQEADSELAQAIGFAPESWEDHASTLRQLSLILTQTHSDMVWLNKHRPPKSVHFAGHLGVSGHDEIKLRERLDSLLEQERVGFAYGALAAGADIIAAEAMIARGAELTAILPVPIDTFIAQSITPLGGDWLKRFEACMEAATAHIQTSRITGSFEPLTINLAGDVGMGSALMNAKRFESHAVQIVIADDGDGPYGEGVHTARDAERWKTAGHEQFVIRAPRSVIRSSASAGDERPVPSRRLLAMVSVRLNGTEGMAEDVWPRIDADLLAKIPQWASLEGTKPDWFQRSGNSVDFAFADSLSAAKAIIAIQKKFEGLVSSEQDIWCNLSMSFGGHFGIVHVSPTEGAIQTLIGPTSLVAAEIAGHVHGGMLCISQDFASSLNFRSPEFAVEYVGDLPATSNRSVMRLFSIKIQTPDYNLGD